MDKEYEQFMNKVSLDLHELDLAPTKENKLLYLVYTELRKVNQNLETLIERFNRLNNVR